MERRRWWALAILGLALLVATSGIPGHSPVVEEAPEPTGTYALDDGTQLWPYTSRAHDVATRTLPINVFVTASPARTRAMLAGGPDEWVDAEPAAGAETYSVGRWGDAAGGDRFTAVFGDDGESVWLAERYQLAHGPYLGTREHVRIYGPVGGSWSAVQAHGEHWDWFRLRHTVDDLVMARDGVVRDLEARDDVTVIDRGEPPRRIVLVGAALALFSWNRRSRFTLAAFGPGALYLGVRVAGIAIERSAPFLHPKLIVAGLYPFVAIGIPTVAILSTRRIDPAATPRRSFALAAGAFAAAITVDAIAMGISAPTVPTIIYRTVAVLAVGLLAAAGTDDGPRLRVGILLWGAAIALPLAGLV